jgi:hypothetical protein
MAGVVAGGGSKGSIRSFNEQRKRRERIEHAADKLAGGERLLRLKYRDVIHQLERCKRRTSESLATMLASPDPASLVRQEALWQELQTTEERRRIAIAAYYLLSFGRIEDRTRFVMHSTERAGMIAAVLESGFVLTDGDKAKVVEVCFD